MHFLEGTFQCQQKNRQAAKKMKIANDRKVIPGINHEILHIRCYTVVNGEPFADYINHDMLTPVCS